MNKPRLAAIDIGTNSFHLILGEADINTGKFNVLGRERELVRLGSGSTDMKYLHDDAIERGIEVLKRFKGLADSAGAKVRAIATSAVREALNQNEFIRRAREETGIKIEIASGVEEARYIYLGVLQALPVFDKRILLIDIGGGSTEFLIGFQRDIIYDISLKLGAIRITQRFLKDKELDSKSIKTCRKFISGYMAPVTRECKKYNYETVVGSSGTISNIANIINMTRWGGESGVKLNNFTFTAKELYDTVEMIIDAKTIKQRMKIPGLDEDRADIITAGALILEQIFNELKIKEMTYSDYALREGILLDTIEKKFKRKDGDYLHNIRNKSVIHAAENYHYDKEHSTHVTNLALKIFDQLKGIHSLGYLEREYLEAAGILHEVGLFVSHSQHHRHSYYLIRNSEILGYTENEKEIIANIARYHRKSHPKTKHIEFAKLNAEDQLTVRKLAGILRIADGLDRSHSYAVKDVECSVEGNDVIIKLTGENNSSDLELDIWGAETKKLLFEETFGVKVGFDYNVKREM
ncbi:MAG TPA: Ppx/GppA phosphatase family protein [Ignavibacteria bacterium]|nr:Ppx/GppA phosphatase family protein [Ignavibacteria bacterium]